VLVRRSEGSGPTITQPSPNHHPTITQSVKNERKTNAELEGGVNNSQKRST